MKPRPALLALCLAAPLHAGFTADDILIFTGTGKFAPGWAASSWGGVKVKESPGENGGVAVEGEVNAETAQWCGLSLRSSTEGGAAANIVPLTDELRENGAIMLKLNCGQGLDNVSDGGDGQKVQIAVVFQLKDGTFTNPLPITLAKLNSAPSLDGDSTTWEEIRVPIRDLLTQLPEGAEAAGISRINVQAQGTAAYNFLLGDCRIRQE